MDQRRSLGLAILGGFLVTLIQIAVGIGSTIGQGQPLKWNGWFTGAALVAILTVGLVVWLILRGREVNEKRAIRDVFRAEHVRKGTGEEHQWGDQRNAIARPATVEVKTDIPTPMPPTTGDDDPEEPSS
jgi:hypothetical protein